MDPVGYFAVQVTAAFSTIHSTVQLHTEYHCWCCEPDNKSHRVWIGKSWCWNPWTLNPKAINLKTPTLLEDWIHSAVAISWHFGVRECMAELNYSTYSVRAARLHHTRGCCVVAMDCGLCCMVFVCSFRRPHLIFDRFGIELNETCFIIMMLIGIYYYYYYHYYFYYTC